MALAKGKSRVKIGTPTLHTKTAIFVAELMAQVIKKIYYMNQCHILCILHIMIFKIC